MSRRKKKNHQTGGEDTVELNLMPFIDIFSLLTTFLLFTAVFVSIGIIEVQVPFLSNATPDKNDKPSRTMSVKGDLQKDKFTINTEWSASPADPQTYTFKLDDADIVKIHSRLVKIRQESPESDLIEFYVDDDVKYDVVVKVMDAIKFRQPGDPIFQTKAAKEGKESESGQVYLFQKVVMSSVML